MIRHLTCINCPLGCALTVTVNEEMKEITVKGNTCPRGKAYGISEVTDPQRMVTSTVFVSEGNKKTVSCKTERPVPKGKIFDVMNALKGIAIEAPVRIGDILLENAAGTGVNVVATGSVEREDLTVYSHKI